jgi:Glycosyltransferase family 87
MTRPEVRLPHVHALPVVAVAVFAGFLAFTIAIAGDTLGFDFLAYHAAASRVLNGQPPYDLSFDAVGGFGLFFYPPAFLPLVLPLGGLDASVATWAWTAILISAFAVGVAILPVSRSVRWWIVLLAGLSWPFLFAVKLGQVGPLLFLAFGAGWRWMDDPVRLGASAALGTAIKLQPGLILGWAILTRRWRAAAYGGLFLVVICLVVTLIVGTTPWTDFVTLMLKLADPISNERNTAPGAVMYQLGASRDAARLVQLASSAVAVTLVVVAALRATAVASYLVAVVASQLVSPILWDHYAMLLLLPVAYLLSIGWRWAVLIPLATAVALVTITPPIVYPIAFYVTLIATMIAGWRPVQSHRATEPSFG